MTSPERGAVALVAFPFVERDRVRERPALIVSDGLIGPENLVWVLMITSAANPFWIGDVPVGPGYADFGLLIPSVVRTSKITTVEARAARAVGRFPSALMTQVDAALRRTLAV